MERFFRRGSIQRLVLLMLVTAFALLQVVEYIFLDYSRNSLEESAQMLTDVRADELFADINDMWYQLNLLSATFSRSEAMSSYLRHAENDTQSMYALRSAAYMTKLAKDNIDSVIVTDFDEIELFSYGEVNRRVIENVYAALQGGTRIEHPTHMQLDVGNKTQLYCVNCTEQVEGRKPVYTIILYNIESLRIRLQEMTGGEYGMNLLLLDGNNKPLLESTTLNREERAALLETLNADEKPENVLFLQSRSLSRMHWRLIAFVQESALDQLMSGEIKFSRIMSFTMLLFLSVFFLILRRQVNEPVRQISHFLNGQAQASTEAVLELKTKNELDQIAQALNKMLQNQRKMTEENLKNKERIYEAELMQKQSEIAALTHQINPHFLYNTLDCMHGMALMGGLNDMEVIISSMACILRYATRPGTYVRLTEELESITHYMNIVHARHGGRIGVCYEVEPGTMDLSIPKMILQPIVENAVFHGLEAVNRKGLLTIRIWRDEDLLNLVVSDNGHGMDEDTLERLRNGLRNANASLLRDSRHIGLINIHRRIQLLYEPGCGVTVQSKLDEGTMVMLRLNIKPPYEVRSEKGA